MGGGRGSKAFIKVSFYSSYFQVRNSKGEEMQLPANRERCTLEARGLPAAAPGVGSGGTSGCASSHARPGVVAGGGAEKCLTFFCVCLVIESGNRSVSLSWQHHYLCLGGQGFKSHTRNLAASQSRCLHCHGSWAVVCAGKGSPFSLVSPGKQRPEDQEGHHMAQLSWTHKPQRSPGWNWPIRGISKREGQDGTHCPTLHHLFNSSLGSAFLPVTRNVETEGSTRQRQVPIVRIRTPDLGLRSTL